MNKQLKLLMILDGYGIGEKAYGNAIVGASKPNLRRLFKDFPSTRLACSGEAVGLPHGQMGNSEVGHTNIGAGRVIYQDYNRINNAVEDSTFFRNDAFLNATDYVKGHYGNLHIMGLLSDGGVHSHIGHLFALIDLAEREDIERVFIHCFMDGRDVNPRSAKQYMRALEKRCYLKCFGEVATVSGRYYAMDRDNNWDRVEATYNAMVHRTGMQAPNADVAIGQAYLKGITDEFIMPTCVAGGEPITSDDAIVFFNFRPDRAREITRAFVDDNFNKFDRGEVVKPYFVCMTEYDAAFQNVDIAFSSATIKNTLGEYISSKGLTQLRIAETEKYAHVTFFLNGGAEGEYEGEDRILVKSPDVATYDLQPEMSAIEVTAKLIAAINEDKYDVIILNYANCDMVGHTGNYNATIAAVEAIDKCVGEVIAAVEAVGGVAIITADHGNAEQMLGEKGIAFTAHSNNDVPLLITDKNIKLRDKGKLSDIAPTILEMLNLEKPAEMTGESLIIK